LAAGAAADADFAESPAGAGAESGAACGVGLAELSCAGRAAIATGFLAGGRAADLGGGGVWAGATAVGRFAVSLGVGAAGGAEALSVVGIAAESGVTAAAPVVSMPAPARERSPPHPASRPKVNRTAA
jgi:hypothetical protein